MIHAVILRNSENDLRESLNRCCRSTTISVVKTTFFIIIKIKLNKINRLFRKNCTLTTDLTISTTDTFNGTGANDSYKGVFSATASKKTYDAGDAIIDSSTTDQDSFTLTTDNDLAAAASIRNIETINVNAATVSTAAASPTTLDFAATNISGAKEYNFDVTDPISAITGLTVTGLADSVKVNASADFSAIDLTATAGKNLTVEAKAVGTAGTPVTVTTSTGSGSVTVTGAGHLSVAPTSTGLVNAVAEKSLTFTAAAATSTVLIGNAKDGNLTVADGTAAVVMDLAAKGDISVTKTGAGSVKAVAGGTITVAGAAAALLTSGDFSSVGESTIDGDALSAMTIAGNGAAATYTMATGNHAALADVTVRGKNDVKLVVESSEIAGALNVYDETTSGTVTVEFAGTTGAVNTSTNKIDVMKITGNAGGQYTVANAQEVTYKADQTAALLAVGTAANAANQSVTIKLDDGNKTTGAVDLTAITITQAKTVTIDASIDTTAAGAANASSIGGITASGANSNVTINTGVNGLTLTGTNTVGTGTLTITGSGPIALGTSTLTATAFDASTATGAVTGTTFNPTNVRTISTGTKADTLTLANVAAADLTINTNAGNDALTLASVTTADKITAIDMGEGEDTLKFQASTTLYKGTTGSVSLAGVETIQFNTTTTTDQGIQASLLNGQTYAVKASAAGGTNSITVKVASTDTAVDMSKLVGSSAVDSTIAGMTFVTDANANTAAIAITGISNAKNTITGSAAGSDVLTGGTLADNFVFASDALLFNADGLMLDTIAGGASAATTYDKLTLGTTGTAVEVLATDAWSKISGVEEIVAADNSSAVSIVLGASAETAGISRITLGTDTGANTISAAAYTTLGVTLKGAATATTITGGGGADTLTGGAGIDTITGGLGNDVITGAGGADVISAGGGDDNIKYLLVGDLFAINALVDTSVDGGDGTDTITLGTSGIAATIAATDAWTGITSVEKLVSVSNTQAVDWTLAASAYTAGIRTVDESAAKSATGNVIDAHLITGGALTLIGSATGATAITGGDGDDTITGGSAADTLIGGAGKDTFVFAATAALNGADTITFIQADDVLNFSAFLGTGYAVLGNNGLDTSLTSFTAANNGDVNIAGKLAVFSLAEAAAGTAWTAAEVLAEINGTGNAFALSAGKAIVVYNHDDITVAHSSVNQVFYIDTTLDGAAGLSIGDIVLVGTTIAEALAPALTTANFA